MRLSRVIRLLIGYIIVYYVLGGIVYAYNADLIYGVRFLTLLAIVAAAMATMEKWHGAVGIYLLAILVIAPNVIANPVRTINDGFINIAVYDGSEGAVLVLFEPFVSKMGI